MNFELDAGLNSNEPLDNVSFESAISTLDPTDYWTGEIAENSSSSASNFLPSLEINTISNLNEVACDSNCDLSNDSFDSQNLSPGVEDSSAFLGEQAELLQIDYRENEGLVPESLERDLVKLMLRSDIGPESMLNQFMPSLLAGAHQLGGEDALQELVDGVNTRLQGSGRMFSMWAGEDDYTSSETDSYDFAFFVHNELDQLLAPPLVMRSLTNESGDTTEYQTQYVPLNDPQFD